MLFPPQTWDIWTAIGVMTIIIGFFLFGFREGWNTTHVFTLALAITTWYWSSVAICRFLAPSLGADNYITEERVGESE